MKISNFKKNIPNIATIFRIIIIIPIVVLMILAPLYNQNVIYSFQSFDNQAININTFNFIAFILFLIASITDWFDGWYARKNNIVSDFGKFWDPIADKILINSVLILLLYNNLIEVWIVILIIIRDVLVDGLKMSSAKNGIVVSASIWGKIKTILLMFSIIIVFLLGGNDVDKASLYYWLIQNMLLIVSLFFVLASGLNYFLNIKKQKKVML